MTGTETTETYPDARYGRRSHQQIESRVRGLKEAGDPHQNVPTLEYLISVVRERPAE